MPKRSLSLLCAAAMILLALSGCSMFKKAPDASEDPEAQERPDYALTTLFEGIKTANIEALKSSIIYPEEIITPEMEDVAGNALVQTAVRMLFKNLDYTVQNRTVEGDTGFVTVEVTYPDLGPIIESNYNAFAPKIAEQLALGTFDSHAAQNEIMWAVAADLIAGKATGTQTETIEVACQKVDGQWKVAPDKPILNVLTGNAFGTMDKLDFSILMNT